MLDTHRPRAIELAVARVTKVDLHTEVWDRETAKGKWRERKGRGACALGIEAHSLQENRRSLLLEPQMTFREENSLLLMLFLSLTVFGVLRRKKLAVADARSCPDMPGDGRLWLWRWLFMTLVVRGFMWPWSRMIYRDCPWFNLHRVVKVGHEKPRQVMSEHLVKQTLTQTLTLTPTNPTNPTRPPSRGRLMGIVYGLRQGCWLDGQW